MGRLYTIKRLPVLNTKQNTGFPGAYHNAYGIQYGNGAIPEVDVEFGEAVEIVSENNKNLKVKRLSATTVVTKIGIILNDVIGAKVMQAGVITEAKANQPITVVPTTAPQGWGIIVPLATGQTPVVGGIAYVQTGASGSVAGAFASAATNALDSGLKFAGTKFAINGTDFVKVQKY